MNKLGKVGATLALTGGSSLFFGLIAIIHAWWIGHSSGEWFDPNLLYWQGHGLLMAGGGYIVGMIGILIAKAGG